MDGILVIDKPEGVTSAAVVRDIKQLLGGKVGHLGTLDPFASGLLPLCLGEGTKIAQFLNAADKGYEGVIRLGIRTDTGDRTGTETGTAPVPPVDAPRCDEIARSFLGEREQTPPMYSAIKQQGVPLYKLARRGLHVDRKPRPIRISQLHIEPAGPNRLRFTVTCSKGTYIRVLAEEIGEALGTLAHLETLRRTRFGSFAIEQAIASVTTREEAARAVISPREALRHLPELLVDVTTTARVRRGQTAALRSLDRPLSTPAAAKLISPDGSLLAVVVTGAGGDWQFARVLPGEQSAGRG